MTSPMSRRDWKHAALLVLATICIWAWARSLWREQGWYTPPEYDIDALETLARIKLASEQGLSSLVTRIMPRLGAPFGADWSSYPMPDGPVFWLLGKLAKFFGLVATGHLAVLLAHLVNVLTFYFCSRTLGHRAPFAACAALLFAFSHYNLSRGLSHLSFMLSFTAPAVLLVSWLIGSSREFLRHRRWQVFCLATAAVTAAGNPYYGLMLVMLFAMALLYQALTSRRAENLLTGVAALFVWGLVTGACHYPAIASMLTGGRKVLVRSYESTELFALRPIELMVPPPYHRLPGAAQFTQEYGRLTHFEGEHFSSYLGAIGIIGLLLVVFRFLRALLRGRASLRPAYAVTIGFVVAFGMVGGLNSVLALTVTGVFRAGNRYTVFILAVGLFALAALASVKWRQLPRVWKYVIASILLCGGLWDQVRPVPSEEELVARARSPEVDWRLGNHLEEAYPPGSMIFQLPAVPFLEQKPIVGMTDYDHFRPFFFTKTMRFSYGVLATEDAMVWQRRVARMAPAEMRAELESAGFAAVYVCRSAYIDGAKALRKSFEEAGMRVTFPNPRCSRPGCRGRTARPLQAATVAVAAVACAQGAEPVRAVGRRCDGGREARRARRGRVVPGREERHLVLAMGRARGHLHLVEPDQGQESGAHQLQLDGSARARALDPRRQWQPTLARHAQEHRHPVFVRAGAGPRRVAAPVGLARSARARFTHRPAAARLPGHRPDLQGTVSAATRIPSRRNPP
jgi:phosphoglycerol transferase